MFRSRAFTLIELLVVISIVALLSGVVLASLNSARDKGKIGAGRQFESSLYHTAADQAVGIWDFDECSGNTAVDRSGYGNDGTFSAVPAWPTNTPSGKGCAVSLNSTTRMTVNHNSRVAVSNPLTVSVWVKTNAYATSVNPRIVQKYDDTNNEYSLVMGGANSPGQIMFRVEIGGTVYGAVAAAPVPLGTWTHVAGVFDGSTASIYMNGAFQPISSTGAFVATPADTGFHVGDVSATGSPFTGDVDSVRLYNKALTAKEVGEIFASERDEFFAVNR